LPTKKGERTKKKKALRLGRGLGKGKPSSEDIS